MLYHAKIPEEHLGALQVSMKCMKNECTLKTFVKKAEIIAHIAKKYETLVQTDQCRLIKLYGKNKSI